MEIILDGIPILVIKKAIRHMYIRVLPPDGRVQITAPYAVSEERIRQFAGSRIGWIKKQRESFAGRTYPEKPQYVTGEIHEVWGRPCRLEVREFGGAGRVFLDGEKLVICAGSNSVAGQRETLLKEWYRGQLKEAVSAILPACEDRVGVRAQEWRIRDMRTRWGSCNIPHRRIWLSLGLAKKPPECLEYVIVHEMIHLLERNHNPRFYRYMDRFYPDWRKMDVFLNGGR